MYKKLRRHPGYLALEFDEQSDLLRLLDLERNAIRCDQSLEAEELQALAEFKKRVRDYKPLTNRQRNKAEARKAAARKQQKLTTAAQYLQKHKAWNWVWPDDKGRWYTNAPPVRGPLCSYSGPSKSVVAGRALRGKRSHNYKAVVL